MPARSKVAMLPGEVRTELERRIVEKAFSGYQDLAEWLQAQGYHIAHDSVQRHGSRLQQRIEAMQRLTHETQAITAAAHQGDGTIVDVTIQLIQQRVLAMLLDSERSEGAGSADTPACAPSAGPGGERSNPDAAAGAPLSDDCAGALALPDLVRMTRIVADLSRVTIARQRRAEEASARLEQREHERHRESEGKGLSEEAYNAIRNTLLGINPYAPDPQRRDGATSARGPAYGPFSEGRGQERGEGFSDASVPACAPYSPEPRGERSEGSSTQQDANSRSSTPRKDTAPVDADAAAALLHKG